MAFKLRHWLGALLFGMAFVAIRLFPGGAPPSRDVERPFDPARERFMALRAEVATQRGILERSAWLDTVTALLEASRTGPDPVILALAPGFPAQLASDFEARLLEEVAGEPRMNGAVDVAVVVRVDEEGPSGPLDEYYVGEHGGRPYCLVRRQLREPRASALIASGQAGDETLTPLPGTTRTRLLGPCAFLLRYGPPGDAMARWLREGAFHRAARTEVPEAYLRESAGLELLGRSSNSAKYVSPRANRCLEGSRQACLDVFLSGRGGQPPVPSRVTELWGADPFMAWGQDFALADAALFADLARAFGNERFARFWTSEADPALAFTAAFGVHPGAWVGDWARSYYGEGRRALRAGPGSWAATLLLVGAALSFAVITARRRRVG